jgi:hypothetical protein
MTAKNPKEHSRHNVIDSASGHPGLPFPRGAGPVSNSQLNPNWSAVRSDLGCAPLLYPAHAEVPSFAGNVVCAKCGARGRQIEVRPNGKEQSPMRAHASI